MLNYINIRKDFSVVTNVQNKTLRYGSYLLPSSGETI